MRAQDVISLFGSRSGDARLEAFLNGLGVKQRPKLPRDETDTHLELKTHGLSLLFEDEAVRKDDDTPMGKGPLVLIGAFFYAQGHEGFSEFEGELPGAIRFSDSREAVVAKLGQPEWTKERKGVVRRDRWSLDGQKLLVDYAADGGSIPVVYYGAE